MKAIWTAIATALSFGVAAADPVLTKEQACTLAAVILEARDNAKYNSVFNLKQPTYVSKDGTWNFFPSSGTIGSVDVFEIRDNDGYYRLGTITNTTFGPAAPQFRIAPSLRQKIRALMKQFAQENQH